MCKNLNKRDKVYYIIIIIINSQKRFYGEVKIMQN